MAQKADTDLQQIKGVGTILAKRFKDAGLDSVEKIASSGEDALKGITGVPPSSIPSILDQARQLSAAAQADAGATAPLMKAQLSKVRGAVETLAERTRERFLEKLSGRCGKKIASDLVRIGAGLERLSANGKKGSKPAGRALGKVQKRFEELPEDASLKKVRKTFKRARKALAKAAR